MRPFQASSKYNPEIDAAIVGAVGLIGLFGTTESLDYLFYCHVSKPKNRSLTVTARHDVRVARGVCDSLDVQIARGAPPNVRRAFAKQLRFLVNNIQHPSLHAKEYDEGRDLWQARVSRGWRFYFTIADDTYQIEKVIPHPK